MTDLSIGSVTELDRSQRRRTLTAGWVLVALAVRRRHGFRIRQFGQRHISPYLAA